MTRLFAALFALALIGCVHAPDPGPLLSRGEPALAELQSRRFDDVPAEAMMSAVVAALQDYGFQVTSSDAGVGLIVAQRGYRKETGEIMRDAWQAVGKNMFNFRDPPRRDPRLESATGGFAAAVSVTQAGSGTSVRVTMHRYTTQWTGEPAPIWAEEMRAPEAYARFYSLLTQALKK